MEIGVTRIGKYLFDVALLLYDSDGGDPAADNFQIAVDRTDGDRGSNPALP